VAHREQQRAGGQKAGDGGLHKVILVVEWETPSAVPRDTYEVDSEADATDYKKFRSGSFPAILTPA
jgi:hypothetical protein